MLTLSGILNALMGPSAYFYGWQVVTYVRYLVDAYLRQFPWQVQISLVIIVLSSIIIILLFILFLNKIVVRERTNRSYEELSERFREGFKTIFEAKVKMSNEEMEYLCKADAAELRECDQEALTQLVVNLRMELSGKVLIVNMQRLCNMSGVQEHLENNMVKGHHVEQTLQILMALPVRITEGALAAYTGHKNDRIRELARAYFGFCSKTEPFRFVMEDINAPFQLWYPTTFHRLCGWHSAKYHPLPQLFELARRAQNDDRKALFISELPYWGNEEEKRKVREILTWSSPKCRMAAIKALAIIGDPDSEEDLVRNYPLQFPAAKRETLRAVAKINTGRQIDFFRQAYLHSTSQDTRAVALACLYNYGYQGRKMFRELAQTGLDDSRFFQQILSSDHKI